MAKKLIPFNLTLWLRLAIFCDHREHGEKHRETQSDANELS